MNILDLEKSKYVFLLGRHYKKGRYLHLDFSGASFKTKFFGSFLKVDFEATNTFDEINRPYIAIYVDNKLVDVLGLFNPNGTIELFHDDAPSLHIVEVVKNSECPVSHIGYKNLSTDGKFIEFKEPQKLKIEIFGDSVTCGYGINASHESPEFFTKEESYIKSYAKLLSNYLDAHIVVLASGGFPINKSQYSEAYKIDNIPDLFSIASFDINSTKDTAPKWDNALFVPDIVITNIGANDGVYINGNSDNKSKKEKLILMKNKMNEFIKRIKKTYPLAKIIVMSNLLKLDPDIDKVLDEVSVENSTYRFISQADSVEGIRPASHPSEKMHQFAAKELEEYIRGNVL